MQSRDSGVQRNGNDPLYHYGSLGVTSQIYLCLVSKVCNHVIVVYRENKLHDCTTAYRHQKNSGEMCLVSNLYFSSKPGYP